MTYGQLVSPNAPWCGGTLCDARVLVLLWSGALPRGGGDFIPKTLHSFSERAGKNKYLCMCIPILICVYNISKVIFFMLNVSDAFFRALARQKGSHFDCSRCGGALDCVASPVATVATLVVRRSPSHPSIPVRRRKRHIRYERREQRRAARQKRATRPCRIREDNDRARSIRLRRNNNWVKLQ